MLVSQDAPVGIMLGIMMGMPWPSTAAAATMALIDPDDAVLQAGSGTRNEQGRAGKGDCIEWTGAYTPRSRRGKRSWWSLQGVGNAYL